MPDTSLYQYTVSFGCIIIVSMFFSFFLKPGKYIPFYNRMFLGKELMVKGNELFSNSWSSCQIVFQKDHVGHHLCKQRVSMPACMTLASIGYFWITIIFASFIG